MITAVDTNILLDVLNPDEPYAESSAESLGRARLDGSLVISDVVYAELCPNFPDREDLDTFLTETGVRLEPLNRGALHAAGMAWSEYSRRRGGRTACTACGTNQPGRCSRCGAEIRPRQHILADFMIGAHAATQADRLLTRDKGYYGTYFPELTLA